MSVFNSFLALTIASLCTCFAIVVSLWQIYMHLINYTEPTYQRYIVRMIFMVPIYAMMSFLALLISHGAIYFNTIRDVYEAWVIYNFLSLCLAWVGGPGAVVTSLTGRLLKPSMALMTCCFSPIPLDGRFIRRCKQGCIQFVILKPILAAVCLILYSYGEYEDGNFSPSSSYLYITIMYTISYSLALYALVLFYLACKDLLKPFRPIPKFLVIKSVVFLTYWQGVIVFIVGKLGLVNGEDNAADLQNLLICLEMALAAVGFLHAFPHRPYEKANVGESRGFTGSLRHTINVNDLVSDIMHQFAPTYHDYVLYGDGSSEAPSRYRTRTFVPIGHEMGSLRKNKVLGSLGADGLPGSLYSSQVKSISTPAGVQKDTDGGLLYDVKGSANVAYDMGPVLPPGSAAVALPDLAISPIASGLRRLSSPGAGRKGSLVDEFDNARGSTSESRKSSTGEDALEGTRLTKGSSLGQHGLLLDEVDLHSDAEFESIGQIQQ